MNANYGGQQDKTPRAQLNLIAGIRRSKWFEIWDIGAYDLFRIYDLVFKASKPEVW
jgi:hypothetical protein